MQASLYYIRFGDSRHVGRFPSTQSHAMGDEVVIQSRRGTEIGQVIATGTEPIEFDGSSAGPRVLRSATGQDKVASLLAKDERMKRFEACRQVFDEAVWPLQLIDVEPLLDPSRTVVYYLGPHGLDLEGIRLALKEQFSLDVEFEPVGRDFDPATEESTCGSSSCGEGEGGCGSGGGCSSCGTNESKSCCD